MTPEEVNYHIRRMKAQGWHLDTHSTILSRKHEAHRCIGKLRFVKPIKKPSAGELIRKSIRRYEEKLAKHALMYSGNLQTFEEIREELKKWQPGDGIRRQIS